MTPAPPPDALQRAAGDLQRAIGELSTAATTSMRRRLGWFAELSAEDQSWVGLIVQSGIRTFVSWLHDSSADHGRGGDSPAGSAVAAEVFGVAPRALTRVISLRQTVDLVRLSIEVVEDNLEGLLAPEDLPVVRDSIARYAREVAFATAEVYARAAESRGAWDARLEALVVDAVLRGETDEAMLSRAAALGWRDRRAVMVVIGHLEPERAASESFDEVRRLAAGAEYDVLCTTQGERMVVILSGVDTPQTAAECIGEVFADRAVVYGPPVDDLVSAHLSARAALSGLRAAPGWPDAPRPVSSEALLPERALAGDGHARRHLVEAFGALAAREGAVETLAAFLECGGSIEATARRLFVHANTVRYRLRQIGEACDLSPLDPRDRLTLHLALTLGRLQSGSG